MGKKQTKQNEAKQNNPWSYLTRKVWKKLHLHFYFKIRSLGLGGPIPLAEDARVKRMLIPRPNSTASKMHWIFAVMYPLKPADRDLLLGLREAKTLHPKEPICQKVLGGCAAIKRLLHLLQTTMHPPTDNNQITGGKLKTWLSRCQESGNKKQSFSGVGKQSYFHSCCSPLP